MEIKISLENLSRIYQTATLGKLMSGLIHNLNGPLQNIGIDMEMMMHLLMENRSLEDDLIDDFGNRLKRMEGEFDTINQLIRTAAAKANLDEDSHEYLNINDFLEQEFSFLNANLHFKHNVQKDFVFQEDLPLIARLPKGAATALSWYIQALVEELEKENIRYVKVRADAGESHLEIDLSTREGHFSKSFLQDLEKERASSQTLRIEHPDAGQALALARLESVGASFLSEEDSSGTTIRIRIPTIGT